MATTALSIDDLEETIEGNEIVLIDFWAGWCGPCRTFAPIYEAVSEKHPDLVFGKVDTEEEQELAAEFGIRSIPTLSILRDGILLFHNPGVVPEAALEDLIRQVRDLDMDEVRRQIAEEEDAAAS